MADVAPPGIDISRPNIARVYDYLLGGKDNFAADREQAAQLLKMNPGMEKWARSNRAFVVAAAARAAREGGIAQFLDLGSGLPSHPAVHEAVREVKADARVAYVDFDQVAVLHSHAEVMRATTAAYVAAVPAGSWLMISAGHAEDDDPDAELRPAYTAANAYRHTHAEFASFFAGTQIMPPGMSRRAAGSPA